MPSWASSARAFIDHHCLRQVVGVVLVEVDLVVERLLADPDGQRARARDRLDELATSSSSSAGRHDAVDRPQSPPCAASIGQPVSSISRARLRPIARESGDHRRRAEEADLHARRGERRVLGRDGEVAGGHELAARRRGDAVHLRDHRLRQLGGISPSARSRRRTAAGRTRRSAADHLAEVVPGGERRAAPSSTIAESRPRRQ